MIQSALNTILPLGAATSLYKKGVPAEHFKKTTSVTDRKQAIKTACLLASEGDIILIAGKGHETYQEIKGERKDFDDFKIVNEMLTHLEK